MNLKSTFFKNNFLVGDVIGIGTDAYEITKIAINSQDELYVTGKRVAEYGRQVTSENDSLLETRFTWTLLERKF